MGMPSESLGHGVVQFVAPQVSGERSDTQRLPQRCDSESHAMSQLTPSQVATPSLGAGQGVHESPHVSELNLDTQRPLHSWKPSLQTTPQRVPSQVACPSGPGLGQGVHDVPHELVLNLETHCPPQSLNSLRHVTPQLEPLQVACPFARPGHGVQELPHEFVLEFDRQSPLQSWVPGPHCPSQAEFGGKQVPRQSCWPVGHVGTQLVPLQLTLPPTGATHGAHDSMPQLFTLEFETHCPLHSWKPGLQATTQAPPLHAA